jgi:hypothetical protein
VAHQVEKHMASIPARIPSRIDGQSRFFFQFGIKKQVSAIRSLLYGFNEVEVVRADFQNNNFSHPTGSPGRGMMSTALNFIAPTTSMSF